MITTFHAYRNDEALLVTEDGRTIAVPAPMLGAAGLGTLRTGQRLVLDLDAAGQAIGVRLP